ncbi:LuxR C-terminal-related transcriptional regulator [Nocardia sp. NPDC057668]|uniref:LuxR C-terminal-related transcriptional regulator n=1 Tax=Nocardia sp. NPDC057668 TaxID=3346202 RepID=UPI0036717F54
MVGNTPVALDSLPCARELLRELDSDDSAPPLFLIRGRSGTGKSVLLGAVRARLRARGALLTDNPDEVLAQPVPAHEPELSGVVAQLPGTGLPGVWGAARPLARRGAALVVDDAHNLTPRTLEKLRTAVESGSCAVIIAARPRPHDAGLRALTDLVARRGRVVDLRALGATEIAPFARELGMMVPRGLAQHIHKQTAGIHGGVVAALSAACATRLDSGITAVDEAVAAWARARLDEADPELLDTFVVAAIGAGLDTSELSEVLDVSLGAAQDLVDRARGGALITDADLLLAPAIAPLRTLVGDRRLLSVQRRLLRARLDAGLLRDHTALLLAESGVRDERLAEFLCTAAEKAGDEAVRHYAAAAAAGADPAVIAVRWADAAARAGDCDAALRLAEPTLARESATPADLAAAVRVCAGVWTRRGLVPRAAQLYSWLGPDRAGPDWAVAAAVLYLAGDTATARALAGTASQWPPTEATARAALIAEALGDSVAPAGLPQRRPAARTGTGITAFHDDSDSGTGHADPAGGLRTGYVGSQAGGSRTAARSLPNIAGPARRDPGTPGGWGTNPGGGGGNTLPQRNTGNPEHIPSGTPATRSADTSAGGGSTLPQRNTANPAYRSPGTPADRDTDAPHAGTDSGAPAYSRTSGPARRETSMPHRGTTTPHWESAAPPWESNPVAATPMRYGIPPVRTSPRGGDSVRAAATAAASALIHAAHAGVGPADNGGDRFLPCSAVSIATLLCLSMGEPRRAADALRGAAADPQHTVLAAWVAMLGGDEQSAAAGIAELDVAALDPRDRLLAHGVMVGLARRSGDHTALVLAWQAAYPLFDEVSADLLALLPIGELWLAGIRLRDESRIAALVDSAAELLGRLGDPPAWSNAFHWYAIQAALAHESPRDLLPHAHRLKAAALAGDPQAAALADAGRTWVLVLRGQVERAPVEAAVARLAELGLIWDAARLASEAALAAADSGTATALLKLARTVRAQARPSEAPVRAPAPPTPAPRPEPLADTVLSEREREVAELVLLGLTYREIGARLYISAKTVEHHVARIRRRIGASSRSELLSMLRAMGHGSLLV